MSTLIPIIQVWPPTAGLEGTATCAHRVLACFIRVCMGHSVVHTQLRAHRRFTITSASSSSDMSSISRLTSSGIGIHNRLVVVILRHVLHIEIDVFGNRHALLQILDEVAWEQPTTRSVRGSAEL